MDKLVRNHEHVINTKSIEKIIDRYSRIVKKCNNEFWEIDRQDKHAMFVGSYGRNTAINTSDVDILIELPGDIFYEVNELNGNSQSRFLQIVKKAIVESYPKSDIRADGQVIKINFTDDIFFEVLPAFKDNDGTFKYADTNQGGKWYSSNPRAEQDAIREKNKSSNNLLISTCRHMRYIRDTYFKSYQLSGIVIDSFLYEAIGNWHFVEPGMGVSFENYAKSLYKYFIDNEYLINNL